MLVLTRSVGQRISIMDGLVTVQVLNISASGQVRLGFVASPEIQIDREEIAQAKRDAS